MKLLSLTTVLFMLIFQVGRAQTVKDAPALLQTPSIMFSEELISFGGQVQLAIKMEISGDEDTYTKHFKNWMAKTYGAEAKRGSGFGVFPSMIYSGWSADSIVVHYRVDKVAMNCALILLIENKGTFISKEKNAAEWNGVQTSLRGQAKDFYIMEYDEVISDQQREYERQSKDVEKAQREIEKLNEKIADESKGVEGANAKMQEFSLQQNTLAQDLKVLNATLQQDKKGQDQAQKELDDLNAQILDKESAYNVMNAEGTLVSKEGKKITKELAKLRVTQAKLQERLTYESEEKTVTENRILKKEESKIKLDGQYNEVSSKKAKHESAVNEARTSLDKATQTLQDERNEMEISLRDLESLKTAKAGVSGL